MITRFLTRIANLVTALGFLMHRLIPNRNQRLQRGFTEAIGWLLIIVLCMWTASCVVGCSGVQMNAQYSNLLDKTAALSAETAARARAGTLPEEQKTQALEAQAKTWKYFQDGRDGKTSTP